MTWLFIRLYVGVLIVLFLAWFIHGAILEGRSRAEMARVIVEAHAGGARLVANQIDETTSDGREQVLKRLRAEFEHPVDVIPLLDLPSVVRKRISGGDDVAYCRVDMKHCVVASLSGGSEVVRLGPFPDYGLKAIEESIGGWMRLTADKLDTAPLGKRQAVLEQLQQRFEFPIEIADLEDLPTWPKTRIAGGEDVVFFGEDPRPSSPFFATTPLSSGTEIVRFGPLPGFERIEQKAATLTLALVLLPAALAIVLLLRPVARQLRLVEYAAKAIAAGDLSARVDERRVRSAKPLAQAFNNMAARTEAHVRTQRELLQAVSHELRTPLSRMRFAIDLIETAKDSAERKQRLESLDAATEELDELVGELLSYVRMETTEPQLNREHVVLREVLEMQIPKHAAMYPSIQFDVSDSGQDEVIVVADRTGLRRVLGNLLSNAGRFAKSRVTISTESTDRATVIIVDDNGSGIPSSARGKVFEPFVRLENGSQGYGVGLGLALVRRIMTQHGGKVEVLTSPWGGCRIETTWPLED